MTADIPVTPSLLSTMQPKRRAQNRYIYTLGQPFNQKFEVLIGPGESNLVVAAKPDQPPGIPDWYLSHLRANSKFSCHGVTILTVHGSLNG